MVTSSLGRASRAALLFGLVLPWGPTCAPAFAAQGHGEHGEHSDHGAEQKAGGDPYLLDVDPVSGKSLGPVAKQVVLAHAGREFRFANQKNVDAFVAAPDKYLADVDAKMIEQQAPLYPLDRCVVSGEELAGQAAFDFIHQNRHVRLSKAEHRAGFMKDPSKYIARLDAAVIERQKADYKPTTCLVSGEKLGGMGDPIDHVVGNRLVRFCCKGCLKDFGKDPLTYLAKLDGAAKETGAKSGKGGSDKAVSYTCPMHADVVEDKAGRCPKCGMDLVKAKQK